MADDPKPVCVWHVRMGLERQDGKVRDSYSKLMTYTEARKAVTAYERAGFLCVIVEHGPKCQCRRGRHAVEREVAKIEEE